SSGRRLIWIDGFFKRHTQRSMNRRGPNLSRASAGERSITRGNMLGMTLAHSKVTAQGQISVPAPVRRKLDVGPGSVLEWREDGEQIIVRRSGRYSSGDIHRALFGNSPPRRKSLKALKEGIGRYVQERHARR